MKVFYDTLVSSSYQKHANCEKFVMIHLDSLIRKIVSRSSVDKSEDDIMIG